jgi:hypothetical protein
VGTSKGRSHEDFPIPFGGNLCTRDVAITLRIYAHLFQKDDGKAAAAINAALKW